MMVWWWQDPDHRRLSTTGYLALRTLCRPISLDLAPNDFYGNEVLYTYDDGIELDSSEGNVRCFRIALRTPSTTISLQPILGGPAYVFRNIVVNVAGEQMKFHSSGTTTATSQETNGTLAYHNTSFLRRASST